MANGSAEFFPLRGRDIGGVTKTWERGTTNMVDDNAKLADIGRTMTNNPDKSREAWASTREASRQIATQ